MTKTSADWILLVAGGMMQTVSVEAAHDLGYKVLVTDRNPECPCAGLADAFEQIDIFDVANHVALVQSSEWRGRLAAVFTAAADPVVTVARAAEAAGCHGLPAEIASVCADKTKTRNALYAHLVPQPKFEQCWDGYGFTRFVVMTPRVDRFIVKSTGGSGSRGHTVGNICDFQSPDFVDAAYIKAREHSWARDVLVEEWLDGIVLSVETLWHNGQMIPLNAVERPFDGIIELGHYNPWLGSAEDYTAVWDVVRQAGDAIGMNETKGGHILKADVIVADDGPKIIELTPRLSGGFDSTHTSPAAHGTDYTKAALLLALGKPIEMALSYFAKRWHRYACCWGVFGPSCGGGIAEIRNIETASRFGDVMLRYNIGDFLPKLEDCTQRVAYCVAVAEEPDIACAKAQKMSSLIEVVIK